MNRWQSRLLFIGLGLVLSFTLATGAIARVNINAARCSVKGIRLYGKVQIVDVFPDLKIQAVNSSPDLRVRIVENNPEQCGEWQIVQAFPNYKVKFVEAFPDLKVQFVNSFPGIP
jgi:hypothetical protein